MMAGNLEWFFEQFDQPLGEYGRIDRSVDRSLDDGKFIAAKPGNGIGLPRTLQQARADGLQKGIADRMAECIVDRLELIEIEAQQRQALAPPCLGNRLFEPLAEQHAVRQVGQRIVVRQMRRSWLRPCAVR